MFNIILIFGNGWFSILRFSCGPYTSSTGFPAPFLFSPNYSPLYFNSFPFLFPLFVPKSVSWRGPYPARGWRKHWNCSIVGDVPNDSAYQLNSEPIEKYLMTTIGYIYVNQGRRQGGWWRLKPPAKFWKVAHGTGACGPAPPYREPKNKRPKRRFFRTF